MSAYPSLQDWMANSASVFEALGTIAFAASGLLEAARKRLDIVGMIIVTALPAFGGGTLRDILLDHRPFYWVANEWWLWIIIGMCLLAMLFFRGRHLGITERAMSWPDAVGLGVFTASGTQVALAAGQSPLIAVIMGTMTAVFGGILRDIAVREIPRAFIDHQPYAAIAFIGGWIVVLGDSLSWPTAASVTISAAAILITRICAIVFGWRLPTWRMD